MPKAANTGYEPDAVSQKLRAAHLQNFLSQQLHRNPRCHAAVRADAQAVCSEIDYRNGQVAGQSVNSLHLHNLGFLKRFY